MRWISEWRQLLEFYRFDNDMDRTPSLIHSDLFRKLRGEFNHRGLCQLLWAFDYELDFSTGEGVVDGQIVIKDNLDVTMIFGGHPVIFPTYKVTTSVERLGKAGF